MALYAIPSILVVLLGLVRPVPPRWRSRYRHWERRPFFWARYGRQYARSARISAKQRRIVFAADQHRCIIRSQACRGGIQVDHIRPWTCGGRTKLRNLMTLCRYHNVNIKNNYWPGVFYRGDNIVLAAAVLSAEQRARCNPFRWVRALLAALLSLSLDRRLP
jgi:hypothetical protein